MATLCKLPEELLCMTAEYLDKQELLSLRKTCREVSDMVDNVFTNTFFSTRLHAFTQYGLQGLVDITTVPRLAAKIKEVKLMVSDYNPKLYANEESKRRAPERAAADSWQHEKDLLLGEGLGQELLSQAFRNLTLQGRRIGLWIDSRPAWSLEKYVYGHRNPAWGELQLFRTLGPAVDHRVLVPADCDRFISSMLLAAVMSKISIRELGLCHDSWSVGIGPQALDEVSASCGTLWPCFSNMECLNINFQEDKWVAWQSSNLEGLLALMKSAAILTTFNARAAILASMTTKFLDVIPVVSNMIRTHPVETLSIQSFHSHAEELADLLGAANGAVRNLQIYRIRIPHRDAWEDVIRSCKGLNSLRIQDVSRGPVYGTRSYFGDALGNSKFDFVGEEAVESGIRGLVEAPFYSDEGDPQY